MSIQNSSKINQLLKKWSHGSVAVLAWLEKQGVSRQLVKRYVDTQWLVQIGHGAYARAEDKVEWTGALYAIQEQLQLPVYVGGNSALELHGLGHFIPLGKRNTLILFGPPNLKLPKWFIAHDWEADIDYATLQLFDKHITQGYKHLSFGAFTIQVSSPERAMMEVLYFLPAIQSWETAYRLMEGLVTLRPRVVQALLESCRSVKVKRVFLFLANYCHHAWLQDLDLQLIDLGSGKRVLEKGGIFNKEFSITVPKMFSDMTGDRP